MPCVSSWCVYVYMYVYMLVMVLKQVDQQRGATQARLAALWCKCQENH